MGKKRILICEDEIIVALDIKHSLEDCGYDVIGIATGPDDAIELANIHNPDLAVLDINLNSWADGIDVANVLREQLNIPSIYLTGNADSNTVELAMKTKPLWLFFKPFNERELCATIEFGLAEGSFQ